MRRWRTPYVEPGVGGLCRDKMLPPKRALTILNPANLPSNIVKQS